MNESFFAGAYGGDVANLTPLQRLECKICWYVYDPVIGDEVWQIQAGTAFGQLPGRWSCPNCGAQKQDFLLLDD